MRRIFVGRWLRGFGRFSRSTLGLMRTTTEAQRRAMILTFWECHGLAAARDAFRVSRSTLFLWKKRLREGDGRLAALELGSRRPRTLRRMTAPPAIIERIVAFRSAFPHYGPKKIAVLLHEQGITIGHATIGKIIARHRLPGAPRTWVARRKRKEKNRLPQEFQARMPGDLVSMDTIILQHQGKRTYILTALDHATRLAMAWAYRTHSSQEARDLLRRMQLLLGCHIVRVLTDNGSEFAAHYDYCCEELGIEHCWTYPRSPEMNGHTERFNRTLQEEGRLPLVLDVPLRTWNAAIAHYICEYNCYRPHQALGYKRPLDRYLELMCQSPQESEMYVGHTMSGIRRGGEL